jgi:ubiquinone/menaquinone biosynthesis C-methylase UbiE
MSHPEPKADRFKVKDASSYDHVTRSYDHYTEMYTAPLAERILELGVVSDRDRVLDVATGTGIVALLAATKLGSDRVTGVDLSDGMLQKAAEKAAGAGLRLTFQKADAEALALPDGSFDVVVSLFGLMHFPHPNRAIAEMFRVLRPGGRVVIGVGSSPPWFTGVQLKYAFSRLIEEVERTRGRWLSAPGFIDALVRKHVPPLDEPETSEISRSATHAGSYLPRMVKAAGFEGLNRSWQGDAPNLSTPEEFWELQSTFSSLARKRLSHATPEQAAAVKTEFFSTSREVQQRGGRLVYRYGALFVAARRPAR